MAGPAMDEDREPGQIEDEPFDVVKANSSLEEGTSPSPRKIRSLNRRTAAKANYEVGELPALSRSEEGSEVDVNLDSKEMPLTRNVTGGRSERTRPMSPPSRAGLDDPEVYQKSLGGDDDDEEDESRSNRKLARGPSYRNEMPMDERQEYEEEMKALALCDLGETSQGLPEFCDTAMTAVNEMCMGVTNGETETKAVKMARSKVGSGRRLKLDGRHTPNAEGNVEEQTAIEVEYVEPLYRGKNDATSPRRKSALLKAMTRKAKDDWTTKGRSPRGSKQDVVEAALNELAEQPNDNVYATFSNAEKRKFLQLINGGQSPFEATSRVLKERLEPPSAATGGADVSSVADSSFRSEGPTSPPRTPSRSGKKSRKLAFWRKSSKQKEESAPGGSNPSTPGRITENDEDQNEIYEDDAASSGDSSCEKVGDEIKKFLKDEAESVKSGSVGARSKASEELDSRFQKSGISYYDAIRKDRSKEDEDEYYNDGQYPEDSKRVSRKIKLPKGFSKISKFKNRATPVPGEAEQTGVPAGSSFDDEEKKADDARAASGNGTPEAQKTAEEIVEELNMDAYLGSTRQVPGIGNSRSFDGASVVSGKSHKTSGTNFTTQSTRSRRVGQAKVRQQTERSILSTSMESTKTRGWQESIEAMAARTGKVWDPVTGWKDYVDPKEIDNSTDGFYSQSVEGGELRRVDTQDSSQPTEPDQLPLWKDTRRPPVTPTRKAGADRRKPKSPLRGFSKSPKRGADPVFVKVEEEKPRGWAATMKAATAKLNLQGKKWDPEKGWTGLSEAEAQSVAETLRHSNNTNDIAITSSSDMQDFGTLDTLDKIANQRDTSMQFVEDEANSDGDEVESSAALSTSNKSGPSGRYMQIGEAGSVQEYQRGDRSRPVIVRKTGLNQDDAGYFPEGSSNKPMKGPVDLDDLYDQERSGQGQKEVISGPNANTVYRKIYESQGNGSFDDAVGTDFSWDADEVTEQVDNTDTRMAVPRLKIKIRESGKNSASKSEASFDSSNSIPKLAAPKRDTSPIRSRRGTPTLSMTPEQASEFLSASQDETAEKDQNLPPPAKETIDVVPPPPAPVDPPATATATANTRQSPVAELHKMWEKRTKSWDKNIHQQKEIEGVPERGGPNSEWKSFLVKKVQAETTAAGSKPQQDDSVFEFDDPQGGRGKHAGAFDDLSELSPIRQADESDSEYGTRESTVVSEASTSVVQGTTFLQRLQACAAPIVTKGSELAKNQNCNADGNNIAQSLASLRDRKGIMQASAGLCGRPDIISEAGEDDSTFQSSIQTPPKIPSRSRSNSRSRRENTNTNRDDMSSVVSEGFGSQSAYLEAIAMKAATGSSKKKKKRPQQGSEVSAASGGPSEVSSAANSNHSEKFQQFLDRRASREASSPPQQTSADQQQHQQQADVSRHAENYASQKVNEMMDSMADKDNRETGAFPTDPNAKTATNDASRIAAEELAAARVEVMMQTLSSQNLEDNEAEI